MYSCKYNHVLIADLKLTEEEDLFVLIHHGFINHQCGRQWNRNLQCKELLGKPLLFSKDWEILLRNDRVLLTPHLDSGYNFGHSYSRESKTGTDANNGWQMIRRLENLSHERNYWRLIRVRLRGNMTAIYKYTGEGSRNGEEELFKPKVTATRDRCI